MERVSRGSGPASLPADSIAMLLPESRGHPTTSLISLGRVSLYLPPLARPPADTGEQVLGTRPKARPPRAGCSRWRVGRACCLHGLRDGGRGARPSPRVPIGSIEICNESAHAALSCASVPTEKEWRSRSQGRVRSVQCLDGFEALLGDSPPRPRGERLEGATA
jgi:hypothetical protein